jgi:hypothetical protein
MNKSRAISLGLVASMLTAGAVFAQSTLVYNKWNIELVGQAVKAGDMVFRVTPRQGDPTDITVTVMPGRDEAKVVKDVRDALAAKLSPDRFTVEASGNDITIKKKDGQPDFALELVDSTVQNVSVKIEGQ